MISWCGYQHGRISCCCLLFFFFFNNCNPNGISAMGNSGCLPRGKASYDRDAIQSMVHAVCFSVSIIHWTLTWTTGAHRCKCMRLHTVKYRHGKRVHWNLTPGEKSLAALGNRICIGSVLLFSSTNWATTPPLPLCSSLCISWYNIFGCVQSGDDDTI